MTTCGWEPTPCGPLPQEGTDEYEPLRAAAADVLWALSGRRFGCCPQPALRPCLSASAPYMPLLLPYGGLAVEAFCSTCRDSACGCGGPDSVRLPYPVCSIVDVRVDGESVTGAAAVYDGTLLERTDGGRWPRSNDLALPDTEPGTWSVTPSRGEPLPQAGQTALGELMSELWKACGGDGSCKLPKRIQTISRQGITMGFLDPMQFLEKGKTGLYFCDLWLSTVNPQARPQAARVVSPDTDEFHERTWP